MRNSLTYCRVISGLLRILITLCACGITVSTSYAPISPRPVRTEEEHRIGAIGSTIAE